VLNSAAPQSHLALLHKLSLFLLLTSALVALAPVIYADVVINDVTQLNPIRVQDVIAPTSVDDIVTAVQNHTGPISIGGGRYSMGGQTATEHGVQIDMRQMNKVLTFSKENKEVTVQAGITWRALQEYIDPYGLSVEIMHSGGFAEC
jgi:FAD/FMN-containing dehydrogenase